MAGYSVPIEKKTLENDYFRKVLFTGKYTQLVVMCLRPGEDIGNEVHKKVDQFFRIEKGQAAFVFNGKEKHLAKNGDAVIVPAVHSPIMLAHQSAKSADSKGRLRPEREDEVRPAFQRDRDRIIHCKAFRRLKHKTQVFFAPTGDHYRTRLTHTLEVSQIRLEKMQMLRVERLQIKIKEITRKFLVERVVGKA